MEVLKFEIRPQKPELMDAMGCKEGDAIYDGVSREYDLLYDSIAAALDVRAAICEEEDTVYVVITAGAEISALSETLFSRGEGVGGLMVNTAADCALFEADRRVGDRIKILCAKLNKGVGRRLDAPGAIPLSRQKEILEKAALPGVGLTEGLMLSPVKSMCYMIELVDDKELFNAQHDCSKCPNKDCPRRTAPYRGRFEIISDFEYSPGTATGVCIDIGTTTIAAVRMENGRVAAAHSEVNRQRRFGADVLTRIDAANRGRAEELRSLAEYQLKSCISAVGGAGPVIAAGNTVMVSLLMGYDCSELGKYPFRAQSLEHVSCGGAELVGGISAFVGGDIVSGLYMCGFDESEDVCLFIDLGTNGEMAIGNRHRIVCTSTAAGPAFEGGRISCGTGSVEGAICAVTIGSGGNAVVETIGDKRPVGICGTGITELAAELLKRGIIDETGKMSDTYNGRYKVADGVTFTQGDVRELQTAKAAIRAGIEILISESGVSDDEIKTVYIAGGFGRRLNIKKACEIGLLPPRLAGKYRAVGNSSLGGCVKILEHGFDGTEHIRKVSQDFPLAENERFTELYLKYMSFGETEL